MQSAEDSPLGHPTLAELRRLSTLRDLSPAALGDIANRLRLSHALPGEVLLELGSRDAHTLYLLEGKIRLTAGDGKTKDFDHLQPTAHDPIARLRPSQFAVSALSKVVYLRIDNDLLDSVDPAHESSMLNDSYQVTEDGEFTDLSVDNRLMVKIYQDLNADQLTLPTLPQVAVRINHAMEAPDLNANTLAKVVSADPAVAAKLLRAANSPRFGGVTQISTLSQAISRIGLATTHNLVMSFAMQALFRTGSGILKQRMRDAWRHSRRVAALCHVLATRIGKPFDPAFALLAGLLHEIGLVAVLGYAREYPELSQDEHALDATVEHMRGQLGGAIVRRWHLPEELAVVATQAHEWQRDPSERPDYADLVLVAQLHCMAGKPQPIPLPRIDDIPAHRKLPLGNLGPDLGLQLLTEAQEEIREVEQLLGS